MRQPRLTISDKEQISEAVNYFSEQRHLFETFSKTLMSVLVEDPRLRPYIHFIKYRVKDPEHLRRKLCDLGIDAKKRGRRPKITAKNLFINVGDLAGVRLLHLHTEQVIQMAPIILSILREHKCRLIGEPEAICWDLENAKLYKSWGFKPVSRESMYTSVHYLVEANQKTKIRAEIQVRTLMEEVWGEVSHKVDYHNMSTNQFCKDQLSVLARLTSGSTRLVDSIFRSYKEGTS